MSAFSVAVSQHSRCSSGQNYASDSTLTRTRPSLQRTGADGHIVLWNDFRVGLHERQRTKQTNAGVEVKKEADRDNEAKSAQTKKHQTRAAIAFNGRGRSNPYRAIRLSIFCNRVRHVMISRSFLFPAGLCGVSGRVNSEATAARANNSRSPQIPARQYDESLGRRLHRHGSDALPANHRVGCSAAAALACIEEVG